MTANALINALIRHEHPQELNGNGLSAYSK